MKRWRLLVAAAWVLAPQAALPCLWVDGTTLAGERLTVSGLSPAKMLKAGIEASPMDGSYWFWRLPAAQQANQNREEHYAVEEILQGNFDEAIALLIAMEQKEPGRYSVASNLGTAYELKGDNQAALQWISEGLRRNPASHEGTEWLHKLILETKLRLQTDPRWLQTHRLVNIEESRLNDPAYRIPADGGLVSPEDLQKALQYQLGERVIFVKPTDPIVADLLYSYGLLTAHSDTVEEASAIMELSRQYGFSNPGLLDQQMAIYRRVVLFADIHFYAIYAGCGLLALLLLIQGIRKKWIFISSKGYAAHKRQKMLRQQGQ